MVIYGEHVFTAVGFCAICRSGGAVRYRVSVWATIPPTTEFAVQDDYGNAVAI